MIAARHDGHVTRPLLTIRPLRGVWLLVGLSCLIGLAGCGGDEGKRLGPFPAGDRQDANAAKDSFSGQVLRSEAEDSTGGNTGAAEIEVYGYG